MVIIYAVLDVRLLQPLTTKGCGDVVGFVQEFGCSASSDDAARQVVESYVKVNLEKDFKVTKEFIVKNASITYDWFGYIEENQVQDEILNDSDLGPDLLANPLQEGIWYRTGRGFYAKD